MTDERRYGEEEVRKIFEEAAALAGERRDNKVSEGLTLAELQSIGRDVGLSPDRIADAAAALEIQRTLPRGTHFGMPVSVRHVVNVPRLPNSDEWDLLLGEVRTTFHAAGRDRSQGNIRQWTNGNLHVYVEPSDSGARIRMGTLKGNGIAYNWLGLAWTVAGVVTLVATGPATAVPFILGALGLGSLISNAIRLPGWARRREEQMIHVAARAIALLSQRPAGVLPDVPVSGSPTDPSSDPLPARGANPSVAH